MSPLRQCLPPSGETRPHRVRQLWDWHCLAAHTRVGESMKTPTMLPEPREWLTQWPAARRSLLANLFHFAVRHGAGTPHAVVTAVVHALQRRVQWRDDTTLSA